MYSFRVLEKFLYTASFAIVVLGCSTSAQESNPEQRLEQLGIVLKQPSPPKGNFVPAVETGKLIFLSGQGPLQDDGAFITGKIGSDLSVEQGQKAARLTGVRLLEALKSQIGDLGKVKRIVKVLGMVNADPTFTQQPQVMNGFSDFMVEVFGEAGKHARSAVGMGSLPGNIAVEIEMIVELK